MKIIHYLKLHNFKVFGEEKTIELDQPSVLIGPNNSGKTSALQGLALWSMGFKRWYESRGTTKSEKVTNTGLNRLDIIQVPVQEARFFWKNTDIRKGSTNYIPLDITVGVEFKGEVHECKMTFTHFTPEVIYCAPNAEFFKNKDLLAFAYNLRVEILYPMSGMITEETLLPEGRINVLIGQGQTAQVLRNLCYQIVERDETEKLDNWRGVADLMKQLFQIQLEKPTFIKSRGSIELKYKSFEVKNPLDISLAGRGLQQMLLLISYLYGHRNSILLLDEPDAHLEILRQKLVFTLLRDLSVKNNNQVIIATHSEVILDEAAETNLVMIIDGDPLNIALKSNIQKALRNFGIEHYYKAKMKKNILYIEGSTDVQILKEFASLVGRKDVVALLESPINYYYIQNSEDQHTDSNQIDQKYGYFRYYKEHFFAIQSVVPGFKGLAIFDSDARSRKTELSDPLTTYYWNLYEIENYFINPQTILRFTQDYYQQATEPIFAAAYVDKMTNALHHVMKEQLFNGNTEAIEDYLGLTEVLKNSVWQSTTRNLKMSAFMEAVFVRFSQLTGQPVMLNKGRYFELVRFVDPKTLPDEINIVLDLLITFLAVK